MLLLVFWFLPRMVSTRMRQPWIPTKTFRGSTGARIRSLLPSLKVGSAWLRNTSWNFVDFFGSIQCFLCFFGLEGITSRQNYAVYVPCCSALSCDANTKEEDSKNCRRKKEANSEAKRLKLFCREVRAIAVLARDVALVVFGERDVARF